MNRRLRASLLASAPLLLSALAVPSANALSPAEVSQHAVVVACPFDPTGGGDRLSRGFYVSNFSASDLHSVTLEYAGDGTFDVTLTARRGRFDGDVLGKSRQTVMVAGPSTRVRFPFGDVAVRPGSTVAFKQHAVGDGSIFYNVGLGDIGDRSYDACPGVTETGGYTPPLGRFRRASVGLVIRA
jgi:hypothetical protein